MTKITDFAALTGASVDAANDLITVADLSETGAARNKKMTFAELKVAIGAYAPGGTDVALADGGTGASLVDPGADRILFWDDSAGTVTWLQLGTNLTITGTTLDAAGGGGGGSGLYRKVFSPFRNEPTASNFSTFDTRNSHPTLDSDGTTQEAQAYSDVLPPSFSTGGVKVILWVAATTATSGDCVFEAAFERMTGQDLDTDSFATAKSVTITVNATNGVMSSGTITFSNSEIDSLVANDPYRLRVRRVPADAADTITTDIETYFVIVEEQ